MSYLLDTDWLIDYLGGREPARVLVESLLPSGLAISVITYAEFYEGVVDSPRGAEHLRKLEDFTVGVDVHGIDRTIAHIFGERRAALRARGLLIDNFDLLIAATALRFDLALVTRNTRDFERIEGLRLHP